MNKPALISIDIFCHETQLETEMILSLHEFGLIDIIFENDKPFIPADHLGMLQKVISFHRDLAINREGIEVILKLLAELENTQAELVTLKNRLMLYE